MSAPALPPIIAVTWDDAHGSRETFTAEEIDHRPIRFASVGWLLRSDAVGVSIAGERAGDGSYRDHTFIPRGMVVSEMVLTGEETML